MNIMDLFKVKCSDGTERVCPVVKGIIIGLIIVNLVLFIINVTMLGVQSVLR